MMFGNGIYRRLDSVHKTRMLRANRSQMAHLP